MNICAKHNASKRIKREWNKRNCVHLNVFEWDAIIHHLHTIYWYGILNVRSLVIRPLCRVMWRKCCVTEFRKRRPFRFHLKWFLSFFLSSLFDPFQCTMAFTLRVEQTWRFAIDIHHLRICWSCEMVSIDRLQSKDWYLILIGKHFAIANLVTRHQVTCDLDTDFLWICIFQFSVSWRFNNTFN